MSRNRASTSKQKTYFWCPHQENVWSAGELLEEKGSNIEVVLINEQRKQIFSKNDCLKIEEESVMAEEANDLISLSHVNDATILNSSRLRFNRKVIYTSIGAVLMAINPFETIPGLYGRERIEQYSRIIDDSLPAHVYMIPSRAYSAMCSFGVSQSLLISGESGAGKTEATKQCLDFLTKVSSGGSHGLDGQASDIASRIIAASPILEAFGNAQTIRNPNSSRFGKWMELIFSNDNTILGSRITSYLLEKSRVTQRDSKERNYHIFYQLLRSGSTDMLQEIQLDARPHTTDYKYLCMGAPKEAKDLKDAENFQEMFDAFLDMGFGAEEVLEIFRVVGSVLTLGNVSFKEIDQGEASVVNEEDPESNRCFTSIANSLGVDKTMLGMALCTRTFQSGGLRKSVTTVRLNPQKAIETKDSLARNLYDKLFKDIIVQINENAKTANMETSNKLIGLLDIFGFEIFEHNSFEQLCINYCNEMLQNHFNFVIFIAETNLYEEENIQCDTITFKPNDGVISKIEDAFKSLDEESRIPRGSSKTWFEKMRRGGQGTPKEDEVVMTFPVKHDNFIVNHYAGPVTYLPENFMEKNTETLSNDLVGVMVGSSNRLISRLFSDADGEEDSGGGSATTGAGGGRRKSSVRSQVPSLSKNFQFQLACLMNMLRTTESHFVRCIKSSAKCMPNDFDAPLIHRQLLYSGVFEVVKIQQSGLPFRLKHAEFNKRYRCLLPVSNRWDGRGSIDMEAKAVVENLKALFPTSLQQLQLGRTMTFMKGKEFRFLETEKDYAESDAANAMKKWCRAARIFKIFKLVLDSIMLYNRSVKGFELDSAADSIEKMKVQCRSFGQLTSGGIFNHLIERQTKHLIVVRKQHHIITSISAMLDDKMRNGPLTSAQIDSLRTLIQDAEEINFEHMWVTKAIDILHRLELAQRSVNSIQSSVQLTFGQLEAAIEALGEYEALVKGAREALVSAQTRLERVKLENDKYVPNMCEAIRNNSVTFNPADGSLQQGKKSGSKEHSKIPDVLATMNVEELNSKECKALYACCECFEECMKLVGEQNVDAVLASVQKFDAIANSLVSDEAPEPKFMSEVHSQFYAFRHWASEKTLMLRLNSVLASGAVESKISDSHMAVVNTLEQTLADSQVDKKYSFSNHGEMVIRFASSILDMRRLYNSRDWMALKAFLENLSHDTIASLESTYPNSILEIENCRWLVEYHMTLKKLRETCTSPSFSLVPIEKGDFSSLVVNISADKDIISRARGMNLGDEVVFASMLDLAEKSVIIREQMASKQSGMTELFSTIQVHQALRQVPQYLTELEICGLLLKIVECENELQRSINSHDISWDCVGGKVSFNSPPKGIRDIETALDSISKLRKCPIGLKETAETVSASILRARRLVYELNHEDEANGAVDSISRPTSPVAGNKSVYRSPCLELRSVETIDSAIAELNDVDISALSIHKTMEVQLALLALCRRSMNFSLHTIMSSRCINGTVGNIVVHSRDIEYGKTIHRKVLKDIESVKSLINGDKFVVSDSEKSLFTADYLSHVCELSEQCAFLLSIRTLAGDNNWADLEHLYNTKLPDFGEFVETNMELKLAYHEIGHLNLIKEMAYCVQNLEISLIANTSNLNPSPSAVKFDKLDNILLMAETVGCHNETSIGLQRMCSTIRDSLSRIKKGLTHDISLEDVQSVVTTVESKGMDATGLSVVLSYIRSHQIVHNLYTTAASTSDSKSLYMALLKAKASCIGSIGEDLRCWIDITEDLRFLRACRKNEDWVQVLDHSKLMHERIAAIATFSDEQKAYCKLLEDQRVATRKEAIALHASTQLKLTSLTGRIGPRGATSFCAPALGVKTLKKVVADLDGTPLSESEIDSSTTQSISKMRALLNLRESVLDEVSLSTALPARRRRSHKIRETDILLDASAGAVEEKVDLKSASAARVQAARERTSAVLSSAYKFISSAEASTNECSFVSDTAHLISLLEELEEAAMLPVVKWDNVLNQVEINDENAKIQNDATKKIKTNFPQKCEDIELVQVISGLQNLLAIARSVDDYSHLDSSLNLFSSTIQVSDIPQNIAACLNEQVLVFQKGHILDQLSALVAEGSILLDNLCFKRDTLDAFLGKVTLLINTAEEKNVPHEIKCCLQCMECGRELCWASELQMNVEFSRFRKALHKVAEDVPAWFHEKLVRWVTALPVPPDHRSNRASISQAGRRPSVAASSLRPPPRLPAPDHTAVMKFSLEGVNKSISFMANKKHTPEFLAYQKPFQKWKNRVLILNTLWRGLFCMTEDWVTPYVVIGSDRSPDDVHPVTNSIMPAARPVFHSDVHALSILCASLRSSIPHEESTKLQMLVSDIERCFENVLDVLQPYAFKNFTVPSRGRRSILRKQTTEYEYNMGSSQFAKLREISVESALNAFDFCKRCVDVLFSVRCSLEKLYEATISFRCGFSVEGSYYFLKASVQGDNRVTFNAYNPIDEWNVSVSGNPQVMQEVLCGWHDKSGSAGRSVISELLSAFHSVSSSSSRFCHLSKVNSRYYMFSIREEDVHSIMNVFDPERNTSISITSLTDISYKMRSSATGLKMVCKAADRVKAFWESHLDPATASDVQDILGRTNAGTANSPLSSVLIAARENIADSIRVLEQKCILLMLTQIGYCLPNYSPWSIDWIDRKTINEACQSATSNLIGAQTSRQEERLIANALIESTTAIHRTTATCVDVPSVLSSDVAEDINKREFLYLSAFATGVFSSDDSSSDSNDDDDVGEMMEQAPKLFKNIVRRRSSVKASAPPKPQKRHSITAAVIQAAPAVFSSTGWDFTHQLAHSTVARFLPSRGIFNYLCNILSLYSSMLEPYSAALFSSAPVSPKKQRTKNDLILKLQEFERFSTSTAMHPAATSIMLCIVRVRSFVTASESDDTLYRGDSGMQMLAHEVTSLLAEWKELAIDHPSTLAIIAKTSNLLDEILCKLEGIRRVQIFVQACRSVLSNGMMTTFPLDVVGKPPLSVDDFIYSKFASTANAKKKLTPIIDAGWIEYLKEQRKAVRIILHQRRIADAANHAIEDNSSTGEVSKIKRSASISEAEALPQISSLAVTLSDKQLRLHLLKEVGVVAMRGARAGVDEKVTTLASLLRHSGCDFAWLRKCFIENGFAAAPIEKGQQQIRPSIFESPEALSPLALKHSQDLVNLMSSLDQLMTHITTVDMTTATASLNQLSPDILKEKVADILFNGSTFQALNTMINPESQVSTRYGRPTTPTDQPSGSTTSVIRLLCARLHFIGYLKHNLWRIGISINSGEITVCAEIGQNESKAHLDAFNNRIPFVPMGMEAACWNADPAKQPSPPTNSSNDADNAQANTSSRRMSRQKRGSAGNVLTYSIPGLVQFLCALQRLYSSFMEVRIHFQENQDQNAIMKSASFLAEMDDFDKRFRITNLWELEQQGQGSSNKEQYWEVDRNDLAIVSFLNLPEWICPRRVIVNTCQQMKEEALYARDCSMITEFHKKLVEALSLYNDKLTRIHMLSANICDVSSKSNDGAADAASETQPDMESPAQREMAAFVETYSANTAAVDALASLIVMPPISAGRELPPDTEELLARARLVLSIRKAACAGRWIESAEQRAKPKRRPSLKDSEDFNASKPTAKPTASRRGSVVKKATAKARINRRASNFGTAPTAIEEGNEEDEDENPPNATNEPTPEPDTVELLVEHWFESIPDPDLNIGSMEVIAISSTVKNGIIASMINNKILKSLHETLATVNPSSTISDIPLLDVTTVAPILRMHLRSERPYSQSAEVSKDLASVQHLYNLLLCRDFDAWGAIRYYDKVAADIFKTSKSALQALFTRLRQEYSFRDYLRASLEDLHSSGQLSLVISTEPRVFDSAVSARHMVGTLDEERNRSMAPDASMGALAHAVYNDYREHGDADKRMLLLYQFLEFNHVKQSLKASENVQSANASLECLKKASGWLSMTPADWTNMFKGKEISKGLHPVLYLRSLIAIERAKCITDWQQQKFRDVVEKVISIPTEVDTSNIDIKLHSDGSRRSYESESSSAIAVKVGADVQERREQLNSNIERNLAHVLLPFRDLYNTVEALSGENSESDRVAVLNGMNINGDELKRIFNHTTKSRQVCAALSTLNWLLVGMANDRTDFSDSSEHPRSSKLSDALYERADGSMTSSKRLMTAIQCNIPQQLRDKLLSIRLQCTAAICEKFLGQCLNLAANGSLRENCGRQQMFIDLTDSFGELSLLITEMKRENVIWDEDDDKRVVQHLKWLLYGQSGEDGDGHHEDHMRLQELFRAGQWVLKLQMAILTEDWRAMDELIASPPPDLPAYPDAIKSFCSLGKDIKSHNQLLEQLEEYLCYSGNIPKVPTLHIGLASIGEEEEDRRPYFHFVDFSNLVKIVRRAEDEELVQSEELAKKISISQFLLDLKRAIDAGNWFDGDNRRDEMTHSEQPISHLAEQDGYDKSSQISSPDEEEDFPSVSALLNNRPEFVPRHIASEIQRVEREFQNQQVEVRLVAALAGGKQYLDSEKFSAIDITDLEDAVDIASSVRQRSHRTTILYESAQKVLNLRRGLKMADWTGIRCWLGESSDLAPEAIGEVTAIHNMSEANIKMHELLIAAMQQNKVGGTYMKLDISYTNIAVLLAALRSANVAPKLSAEDKQIVYSAECLKAVRVSILMADYTNLVEETERIEFRGIASCALDELLLVKRAISFFETLKRISLCLRTGPTIGPSGMLDTQNLSLYQLNSALVSVDPKTCSDSIRFFLTSANVVRGLRAAIKGGIWGTVEASESLIQCAMILQQQQNKHDGLDNSSFTSWTFVGQAAVGSSQLSTFEKMGMAFEHLGKTVRKLDYGKEILGGDWRRRHAENIDDEEELLRRSGGWGNEHVEELLGVQQVDGNYVYTGLSAMLAAGLASRSKTHRAVDLEDDFEPHYRDLANRELHVSACLRMQNSDAESVSSILGNLPDQILLEIETELLHIRDELYHRIVSHVFQRGFMRECTSANESLSALASSGGLAPVPIECAIIVAQHLGLKSKSCRSLYFTAKVVADLRKYLKMGNVQMVLDVLGRVRILKSSDMFAPIAANEIEDAFLQVCGSSISKELIVALDKMLPVLDGEEQPVAQEKSPKKTANKQAKEVTLEKTDPVANLRKAIRSTSQVVGVSMNTGEIKVLKSIGEVLMRLKSSICSGVVQNMQSAYDDACTVVAEIDSRGPQSETLYWLLERLEKEMSIHRRHLIKEQLTSPLASSSSSEIGVSIDKHRTQSRIHFQQHDDLHVSKLAKTGKANGIIHTPLFHGAAGIPSTEDLEVLDVTDADILREMIERALNTLTPSHPSNQQESSRSPQKTKYLGGSKRYKSDVFLYVKKKGDFQALLEKMVNNPDPQVTALQRLISAVLLSFLATKPRSTLQVRSLHRGDGSVLPVPILLLRLSVKLLIESRAASNSREGGSAKVTVGFLEIGEFIQTALLHLSSDSSDPEYKAIAMFRLDQLSIYLQTVQSTEFHSFPPSGVSECKSPGPKHISSSTKTRQGGASSAALKFAIRQVTTCKKNIEERKVLRQQVI